MAKGYSSQGHGQQKRVQQAIPSNPLAIKTKKFALEKNKFIVLNMLQFVRKQWYWAFVPLALILINAVLNITKVYPNYWIYVITILGALVYVAFWAIQFTGVTQLDQYKQLFQKYRYEIDSRQILMKLNDTEGGVIKWDIIKNRERQINELILTHVQYVGIFIFSSRFNHIPFDNSTFGIIQFH